MINPGLILKHKHTHKPVFHKGKLNKGEENDK